MIFQWLSKDFNVEVCNYPIAFSNDTVGVVGIFRSGVNEVIYCDYLSQTSCNIKGYYQPYNTSHATYVIIVGY